MQKKITIAIDGYTGTGKGTTAKRVAKALGYTYLDTGAMYRAVTLYALREGLVDADDTTKANMIDDLEFGFLYNSDTDTYDMILNGENVEQEIRKTTLALQMKPIVSCIPLRQKLIERQAARGTEGGVVADGRDMGTHVFPDAQVKIFMTCDVETRVQRRIKQLTAQGLDADKALIREETIKRDDTDYLGTNAVNKKAIDAVELDTTNCTIDEQVGFVLTLAQQVIEDL